MSYSAATRTHTVVTIMGTAKPANVPSIREIILFGLMTNIPKDVTEQKVKELHPQSAAAAKFNKHYSQYRSELIHEYNDREIANLNRRFGTNYPEMD